MTFVRGEAPGHLEQVARRRAGEAVDRLVVVAHDAEVVAPAEPAVEQRLLQQVDVLVLVDGEGLVAGWNSSRASTSSVCSRMASSRMSSKSTRFRSRLPRS